MASERPRAASSPLAGRTVVVTAGPTREHIDPVRFLTNASSGRMGYCLAAEARRRGARVTLISGPVSIARPGGVRFVPVVTVDELRRAVLAALPRADVLVMAAAVGDWRFAKPAATKLKKTGDTITLSLEPTPDILREVGERRAGGKAGPRVLVGFALETDRMLSNAKAKLKKKRLDLIVANSAGSLGGSSTSAVLLGGNGVRPETLPPQSKERAAARILDRVEALL